MAGVLAGAAGAVGAAGASSISIIGSINVESITAGLKSMGAGLSKVKETAKSAFGGMTRLLSPLKSIGLSLVTIGLAAGTAALGIAAMAPQVAPILARMGVEFGKLTRILGKELKPVFEIISEVFSGFVSWLGSEQGRGVIQAVVGTFESLYVVLQDVWKWLSDTGAIDAAIGFFIDLETAAKGALDGIHKVFTGEISLEDLMAGFWTWTSNMSQTIAGWVGYLAGSLIKSLGEMDWGELFSNALQGMFDSQMAIAEWAAGMGGAFATGVMQGARGEEFSMPSQSNVVKTANEVQQYNNEEVSYTMFARWANLGGG